MAAPNLTRDQAEQRATLLNVDSYVIELDLTDGVHNVPGERTLRSTSTVYFRCSEVGASSWIDVVAERVESAVLNGVELDVADYREEDGIALHDLTESNELVVTVDARYM
ncbi:MAG: aminopeptidase N, partial [Sciscionella sp.]